MRKRKEKHNLFTEKARDAYLDKLFRFGVSPSRRVNNRKAMPMESSLRRKAARRAGCAVPLAAQLRSAQSSASLRSLSKSGMLKRLISSLPTR